MKSAIQISRKKENYADMLIYTYKWDEAATK